jgi:hypothetical protein
MYCRLKERVMDGEEWEKAHATHGKPTRTYNESQPPAGYKLYTLTCPCGAKLVGHERTE